MQTGYQPQARMPLTEKVGPQHTALIVIDIQNDFASPDKRFFAASRNRDLSMCDPMIDKLEQVIPMAESAGVLVLYTQQLYDPSKLNVLKKEQYELDGKLVTVEAGTKGADFYRISPPTDRVFVKYDFNIFSNPNLVKLLEERSIKTLVITGMDIIFCVETAIRNGYDLGYKIVVPEDLIAGNAKYMDWNTRTLEITKYTFGVVTSSAELMRIWTGSARS